MNDEELDEQFKEPGNPLRLVFVCAMWLTGFDAPSCSTVYLDKPMPSTGPRSAPQARHDHPRSRELTANRA